MDLKIIHTADVHFDTPFSGLSETEKAAVRRQDLRTTFSTIISMAQNADMLFISGDLFDGRTVSRTTLDFLKREFFKIKHVKVFIAAGNHDCFHADSVYATFDFGENVHVFGTEPEVVETESADIYGISFQTANEFRELLPRFQVKNPAKMNLLVMHGNLMGEGYNPVQLSDIETQELSVKGASYLMDEFEKTLSVRIAEKLKTETGRSFQVTVEGKTDETGEITGVARVGLSPYSADFAKIVAEYIDISQDKVVEQ